MPRSEFCALFQKRDPFMEAASDLVDYASKRMNECIVASLDTAKIKTFETVKKESEEISARSRLVTECVNVWNAMGKERMPSAAPQPKEDDSDRSPPRSYFDYIAQLKHVEIPKPPESQISCAELGALHDDPTLAYVDVPIERAFEIGKFDVLRKDPESGRKFFEFSIPRDCDVVRDIRCSNDFEVSIGSWPYGKAEGDAILLIAAQFHEVKVKIFVEQGDVDVTLSYVGSLFENDHRRALACASWETKTAFYCGGMVSKI